ncbi:hypothetical protein IE077_003577, partial [Cardiosporidium cionae]
VTRQPAQLCTPMVMEPLSNFYWSPVIVLDFQSLYPSMIIAYNLCYSTYMGSLQKFPTVENSHIQTVGTSSLHISPSTIKEISKRYNEATQLPSLSTSFKL